MKQTKHIWELEWGTYGKTYRDTEYDNLWIVKGNRLEGYDAGIEDICMLCLDGYLFKSILDMEFEEVELGIEFTEKE